MYTYYHFQAGPPYQANFHPLFLSISLLRLNAMLSLSNITLMTLSLAYLSSAQASYAAVCSSIVNAVSAASQVAFPGQHPSFLQLEILKDCRVGDPQYNADIFHFASSSSQPAAACTVEPGTVADIGIVVGRFSNLPINYSRLPAYAAH